MSKIRIECDDTPDVVIDKMTSKLKYFGITITQLNNEDGFIEYEISRDPSLEDESHSLDLILNKMIEDDPELFGEL